MASVVLLGTPDTQGVEYAFLRDPAAHAALIRELTAGLRPEVEVVEWATGINDPALRWRWLSGSTLTIAPGSHRQPTNREGCAR